MDAKFAAAVAWFAGALRNDSQVSRDWNAILNLAKSGIGKDPYGERTAFTMLIGMARDAGGG